MSRRVAVIVASDRGYSGERKDLSGPEIRRIAEKNGYTVVSSVLLPDDREKLEAEMCRIADDNLADLILTSGGDRAFLPGTVCRRLRRRWPSGWFRESRRPCGPAACRLPDAPMLSRSAAGIRKQTLIVNLPGSP